MPSFACPSCGAELKFRSGASVSAVCDYCQTLAVRTDSGLEDLGKVAALPPDMTPFQVGTQAYDGSVAISLLGRLRLAWADGFWSEWYFVGDDGRQGWLAEAQGTYALSYEYDKPLDDDARRIIDRLTRPDMRDAVGIKLTLEGRPYTVTDRKDAVCIGCEGELPLVSPRGRQTVCFDFMGRPDHFASLEIARERDQPMHLYVGRYVDWDDLKASNLRAVEGWS